MRNRMRVKRRTGIGERTVDLLPETWCLFHWVQFWLRNPWLLEEEEKHRGMGVVSLGFFFCSWVPIYIRMNSSWK